MDRTLSSIATDRLAAAVLARLGDDGPDHLRRYPEWGAVEVTTQPPGPDATAVVAAVTDDTAPCSVVGYAQHRAHTLGLRLRVTHVWSRRPPELTDVLLASVLYNCLNPRDAAAAERAILHDPDTGRALQSLSRGARLLVLSAGTQMPRSGILGDTVISLIGHTPCPLAIVLPPPIASPAWWTGTAGKEAPV
jgi:hypothetical protein